MSDERSAGRRCRRGLAAILSMLLGACGAPPEPGAKEPLETVEVGPAPDAQLSLDEEVQAEARRIRTGGVLPEDFPADFPTYPRSSLIDFGVSPEGHRFLLFDSGSRADEVQEAMLRLLRQAGWQAAEGRGPGTAYRKNGRVVGLEIRPQKVGSAILLYY